MIKINKVLKLASLAGALLFSNVDSNAQSIKGSLEVLAGDKSTTTDLKFNTKLSDEFSLFARNRIENPYQKSSVPLTLIDLNYNAGKGFSPLVEGLFTQKDGAIPRAGFTYQTKLGNISLNYINIFDLKDNPSVDLHPIISYSHRLNDRWNAFTQLEVLSNLGLQKGNHNFTSERVRLGLEYKGFKFGVGADFKQTGDKFKQSNNYGGFVSKSF